MRRVVIIVTCLIFFLIISSLPAVVVSNEVKTDIDGINDSSQKEPWWKNWSRDKDKNGIDDLIDEKIATDSQERVPIYIKYERELTPMDSEIVSDFDLEEGYILHIINTISARDVDLKDIPKLRNLPGVGMIELQMPFEPHVDISNPTVKARNSTEYSPNTAWALGYTGKGINIAIADTGVDDFHESLLGRFVAGVSFGHPLTPRDGSFNPDDEFGHGTYCAGIALGTGGTTDLDLDGEPDYMGAAPDAGLIDVQIAQGMVGTSDPIAASIQWCILHKDDDWNGNGPDEYDGIDIISLSVRLDGSPGEAAAEAAEAGIIVVSSAGNDGPNNNPPSITAWPDDVVVVGATYDKDTITRDDDDIASFSSRGPREDGALKPDVSAPGQFIVAPTRDSFKRYGLPTGMTESGTSFSSPLVAGVVALMLEAAPNLKPKQVIEILHDTAEARGDPYDPEQSDKYNTAYGWGIVDAYEAVLKAIEYDDRPPIISHIDIEVNGLTASISWHTHKAANTTIEYGLSEDQLDDVYENPDNFTWNHKVIINRYMGEKLEESTDYFFKIKCWDEKGYGPGESDVLNFKTATIPDTEPPWIFDVTSIVFDTSATIKWKTNEDADSLVEYGLTTEYGFYENDLTPNKNHTITLTGLESATTYYYRVNSTDGSGNTNHSDNHNFTTVEQPDTTPPEIYSVKASSITDTSAIITWETDEPSSSLVRYGTKKSHLGNPQYDEEPKYEHEIILTGLKESTTYYYEVESKDNSPNHNTNKSEVYSFKTLDPIDDVVPSLKSEPKVTILTDTSATIEWETDEECEGWVEYGKTKKYGYKEPESPTGDYVFVHNITLTGLDSAETYYFIAVFTDKAGNQDESDDYSFSTLPPIDKTPPELISGPNLIFVGETTATIVWVTDEQSDSEVYYGTTTSYGSQITDSELSYDHEITLTALTSGTTYHYMVKSTDSSGNSVESEDYFFETKDISIPIDIEFLNIVDGQIVTGIVEIEISVSAGPNTIEWVRYKVDNESWKELEDSYTIVIDTKDYSEGEHTLFVEASDGRTTKIEEVTFEIEHEPEVDEDIWMWVVLFVIIAVVIILVLAVVYRSVTKKGIQTQPVFTESEPPQAVTVETDVFSTTEAEGISFIPDEQEPEIFSEPEAGISFVPDAPTLGEESDISFVPDREEISFNVFEEEPIFIPSTIDTVRCPRCKSAFDANISSKIECPECGFTAELRR